jgi:outer membrane lipoprotein SlyB
MTAHFLTRSATAVLVALLAACQTLPYGSPTPTTVGEHSLRLGTITSIQTVALENEGQLGLGAVLGAAAGGLLGHQIGSGSGQDVATVLGVIGGAVAGNVMQKKYPTQQSGQSITVRLDNGVSVVVTQQADPALRIGDTVRIEGSGTDARVRLR